MSFGVATVCSGVPLGYVYNKYTTANDESGISGTR